MANNYCQCTPDRALKVTEKEAELLKTLMELPETEDDRHGFRSEYYDGRFYMFAEEYTNEDNLPKEFLKELGKIIAKNKMKFLEFGYAVFCSKLRPGEFGGGSFRVTSTGKILYPKITW